MEHTRGVLEAELSAEQRAILRAYWWRWAEGEKTSWVAFEHLIDDLRTLGVEPHLVETAERARADELKHSGWCRDWAVHFGHEGGEPRARATERQAFRGASDEENRVLRMTLGAFSETYGCVLLRSARARMTEQPFLQLNQRHLADEVQHSRLGWAFLAQLTKEQRGVVLEFLPALFEALEDISSGPEEEHDALIGLGYLSRELLDRSLVETTSNLILPGLALLDLERT